MSEIFYSEHQDDWMSCDESIEEVATLAWEMLKEDERPKDRVITLYKGLKVKQNFSHYLNITSLIDEMANCAYDNAGEAAEDYLSDITNEQMEELESLICEWAERHNICPEFFMIEKIEPVKFTVPNDWD